MSRGPGKIERIIAELVRRKPERGWPVWVGVITIAREAYGTNEPTRAQRVSILRAMHSFVVRHDAYKLDGGNGRTPLGIVEKKNHRVRTKADRRWWDGRSEADRRKWDNLDQYALRTVRKSGGPPLQKVYKLRASIPPKPKAALRPEEQQVIDLLEKSWGRALTDQQVAFALKQARAIGEI